MKKIYAISLLVLLLIAAVTSGLVNIRSVTVSGANATVSGWLPDYCWTADLMPTYTVIDESTIHVFLTATRNKRVCSQVVQNITKTYKLSAADAGVAPGTYTVLFNGLTRFARTITLP